MCKASNKIIIIQMYWLIGIFSLASSITACPPWTFHNESSKNCQCGITLQGVVDCTADPYQVSILRCYCMTYNEEIRQVTVGKCLAMCSHFHSKYQLQANDSELLNVEVCGDLNRTGQMCGDCIEGYGPAVYSYSLHCVECNEEDFAYNLLTYLCTAFLPLTLFYFLVIILRISITSHQMVAYVFICQIVTTPSVINKAYITLHNSFSNFLLGYLLLWNLDFFRIFYTPFCLHPKLNTMQVIALDYLVAVYPMFLIVLTYIAVALHDRCPLIVILWRPMQRVFTCIRKEWNIRGSLVQAFATFLVLSYVKILNVSFELLNPIQPYNISGPINHLYLFSAGTIEYFGTKHLPYGILALMMILMFNILPVLFLMLYPYNTFRKCFCRKHSHGLFIFMDVFHGCYSNKPKDYRSFATIYFISRFTHLVACSYFEHFYFSIFVSAFHFMVLSLIVTFLQPYKNKLQNKLDVTLLICTSFMLTFYAFTYSSRIYEPAVAKSAYPVSMGIFGLVLLYGPSVLIFHIIPQKVIKKLQHVLVKNFKKCYAAKNEDLPLLTHD